MNRTMYFFLPVLLVFLGVAQVNGSGALVSKMPPKRIQTRDFYKPLYETKYHEERSVSCFNALCERFLVTCCENHEYCPECDKKCKECTRECQICLEQPSSDEEDVLACNHHYHKTCIKEWFDRQRINRVTQTCPMCREEAKIKAESQCSLCHTEITVGEPSCSYTCRYDAPRAFSKCLEKHVFHSRCIRSFALYTAFRRSDGELCFRCPADHEDGCVNPGMLDVKLLRLGSIQMLNKKDFPSRTCSRDVCSFCHKSVIGEDAKNICTYRCTYQNKHTSMFGLLPIWSNGLGSYEHRCHVSCVKPFAERNAYLNGEGNVVFRCPSFHDVVFEKAQGASRNFEAAFPKQFLPQVHPDHCCLCDKPVNRPQGESDDKVRWLPRYRNCRLLVHHSCLSSYIYSFEDTEVMKDRKPTCPCPVHRGTKDHHEFELDQAIVVS